MIGTRSADYIRASGHGAAQTGRTHGLHFSCLSSVQQRLFDIPAASAKASLAIRLLAKKPAKLVAVAVANKMACIAWAIMAKGGYYRAPALAAAA